MALPLKKLKDVEGGKEIDNDYENKANNDDNAIIRNSIKMSIAHCIPGIMLSKTTHSQMRNMRLQEVQYLHRSLRYNLIKLGLKVSATILWR